MSKACGWGKRHSCVRTPCAPCRLHTIHLITGGTTPHDTTHPLFACAHAPPPFPTRVILPCSTPLPFSVQHTLLHQPALLPPPPSSQVVLDRGVPQERILFLCLLAAPEALAALASTYPGVKVLTSEIEDCLDEECRVVPGVGEFGDRYFCE